MSGATRLKLEFAVFLPFSESLISMITVQSGHHEVTQRQKVIGIGPVTRLLEYIKDLFVLWGLLRVSTQHRITYDLINASTLCIISGIIFIWLARSLEESQFL